MMAKERSGRGPGLEKGKFEINSCSLPSFIFAWGFYFSHFSWKGEEHSVIFLKVTSMNHNRIIMRKRIVYLSHRSCQRFLSKWKAENFASWSLFCQRHFSITSHLPCQVMIPPRWHGPSLSLTAPRYW